MLSSADVVGLTSHRVSSAGWLRLLGAGRSSSGSASVVMRSAPEDLTLISRAVVVSGSGSAARLALGSGGSARSQFDGVDAASAGVKRRALRRAVRLSWREGRCSGRWF